VTTGGGRGGALLGLLRRNPDFRRLFLAAVVSLLGDWFAFVAVSGLLLAARGLGALTGPFLGRAISRGDGRRLVFLCGANHAHVSLGRSLAAVDPRPVALPHRPPHPGGTRRTGNAIAW